MGEEATPPPPNVLDDIDSEAGAAPAYLEEPKPVVDVTEHGRQGEGSGSAEQGDDAVLARFTRVTQVHTTRARGLHGSFERARRDGYVAMRRRRAGFSFAPAWN